MGRTDYEPGDRIIKTRVSDGEERVYVVADPARTSRGKLRLIGPSGAIRTTWWVLGGTLPPHYRAEVRP